MKRDRLRRLEQLVARRPGSDQTTRGNGHPPDYYVMQRLFHKTYGADADASRQAWALLQHVRHLQDLLERHQADVGKVWVCLTQAHFLDGSPATLPPGATWNRLNVVFLDEDGNQTDHHVPGLHPYGMICRPLYGEEERERAARDADNPEDLRRLNHWLLEYHLRDGSGAPTPGTSKQAVAGLETLESKGLM